MVLKLVQEKKKKRFQLKKQKLTSGAVFKRLRKVGEAQRVSSSFSSSSSSSGDAPKKGEKLDTISAKKEVYSKLVDDEVKEVDEKKEKLMKARTGKGYKRKLSDLDVEPKKPFEKAKTKVVRMRYNDKLDQMEEFVETDSEGSLSLDEAEYYGVDDPMGKYEEISTYDSEEETLPEKMRREWDEMEAKNVIEKETKVTTEIIQEGDQVTKIIKEVVTEVTEEVVEGEGDDQPKVISQSGIDAVAEIMKLKEVEQAKIDRVKEIEKRKTEQSSRPKEKGISMPGRKEMPKIPLVDPNDPEVKNKGKKIVSTVVSLSPEGYERQQREAMKSKAEKVRERHDAQVARALQEKLN